MQHKPNQYNPAELRHAIVSMEAALRGLYKALARDPHNEPLGQAIIFGEAALRGLRALLEEEAPGGEPRDHDA